jgi:membrane-bound ClpP family serine protease
VPVKGKIDNGFEKVLEQAISQAAKEYLTLLILLRGTALV